MTFSRFVETGRIAKCAFGPLKSRIVSIVDVIDQNRVLIDGPLTGVPRQQYRLDDLYLTKFRIKFPRTAGTKTVRKAWKENKTQSKFKKSTWNKKAIKVVKKTSLNDFDRFKLRSAKRSRNKLLTVAFNSLKRKANKEGLLYGKPAYVPNPEEPPTPKKVKTVKKVRVVHEKSEKRIAKILAKRAKKVKKIKAALVEAKVAAAAACNAKFEERAKNPEAQKAVEKKPATTKPEAKKPAAKKTEAKKAEATKTEAKK